MTVFMHKALLGYSDTLAAQVINAKNVAVFDTSPETIEHLRKLREHIYELKPEDAEAPEVEDRAQIETNGDEQAEPLN